MEKKIKAPIDKETARSLKTGDSVLISGVISTRQEMPRMRE